MYLTKWTIYLCFLWISCVPRHIYLFYHRCRQIWSIEQRIYMDRYFHNTPLSRNITVEESWVKCGTSQQLHKPLHGRESVIRVIYSALQNILHQNPLSRRISVVLQNVGLIIIMYCVAHSFKRPLKYINLVDRIFAWSSRQNIWMSSYLQFHQRFDSAFGTPHSTAISQYSRWQEF